MLRLKNIHKNYLVDKKPFPALKNINLTFSDKGFVSILGPSGCGKTTLLNLIGGLDQYTSGDLIINNKSTKQFTDRDWDAYRNRRVGFVFQSYNLVPHLTVLGNVDVSMKLSGLNRYEREKRALQALKKVGLKNVAYKKPNQLSGGQMQRVAIARSLVNDPEIILADEPTGALDSVTSVQVMKILKKISSSHLVIMVTHNEELAKEYSTRIIKLKDGRIISDSNPPRSNKVVSDETLEQEKNKHTHMSFFTALASSAKSLLTKKGRTAMTAIAASFGIIGVSLVLALSNGFSNYVHSVEVATASTVPITISPFVTTNIKDVTDDWKAWPEDQKIFPYDDQISSQLEMHHNKITKDFASYAKGLIQKGYASSVLENHEGLDFNVFTTRPVVGGGEPEIIKVNQYNSAGTTGTILSSIGGLPTSIFHELYGGESYIKSLYDVVAGRFPKNKNEVVVVCDRYNRLPLNTLYQLGYINSTKPEDHKDISFSDILDKEYKAFTPEKVYTAVKDAPVITQIPATDYKIIESVGEGDDRKEYPFSLKDPSTPKEIKQYVDVTAKDYDGSYKYAQDLQDLYDEKKGEAVSLKVVGIIRPSHDSQINLMPGSICYTSELKDYFVNEISNPDNYVDYKNAARNNWVIPVNVDPAVWNDFIMQYIRVVTGTSTTAALLSDINKRIQFYDILTPNTEDGTAEPINFDKNPYTKFQTNNYKFANEYQIPQIELNLSPLSFALIRGTTLMDATTFINGYSTITSILIFPKDLSSKANIFNYLEQYNVGKTEDDKIVYSDVAGSITDAVGTLIDIISIVLICFSAISLLVSCVMTGVITYTSVLERTKEIGILRAIGARKKDVGRLFEAESVIIGGIAGIVGVLFTFIVEYPMSLILTNRFPEQNIGMICNLSPWHALLLVFVSILLTFVAGFIPARKASKKDPVVALRTE